MKFSVEDIIVPMRATYKVYFLIVLIVFFSPIVFAYVDPGTGSYLVQVLAAVFLTLPFFFSKFLKKIKGIIRSFKNKSPANEKSDGKN